MLLRQRTFFNGKCTFRRGDLVDVLAGLPENSFDSCVTDPPYHLVSIQKRFGATSPGGATQIEQEAAGRSSPAGRLSRGFMGKTWDGGDVAQRVETWQAVYRVLKPGAYIAAFSSTRTQHRQACAIEDAGFIVHPMFGWLYGSGFPKATNPVHHFEKIGDVANAGTWRGWLYGGQAVKPAMEPVFIGQKPFSEATGPANLVRWGVGAMNIDGCRVLDGTETGRDRPKYEPNYANAVYGVGMGGGAHENTHGRYPANVIHDGSPEVLATFPDTKAGAFPSRRGAGGISCDGHVGQTGLDPRSTDSGSAARYFNACPFEDDEYVPWRYQSKPNDAERAGSQHPTIKPVALMRHLVRLLTPPEGCVLDPFAGSGTTGEAAARESIASYLIDLDPETAADLERRETR